MTATAAAVVLALFWLAPWRQPLRWPLLLAPDSQSDEQAASADATPPTAGQPAPVVPAPQALTPPPDQTKAAMARAAPTSEVSASTAPPSPTDGQAAVTPPAPAVPAPAGPSFDIVRVEPTGDTVIAGRADPDADVELLDNDRVIAKVHADATGQFALVPSSLEPGNHYLTLRTRNGASPELRSSQGVAVSIASGASAKPLVALLSPDKPAQILSDGAAVTPAAGASSGAAPAAAFPTVAIQSVEAAPGGSFMASGVARPGSKCRIYLNGAFLADVKADHDGRWSVEIKKGMRPGRYTVRTDELEQGSDVVAHRAEVPFDYPESVASEAALGGRRTLLGKAERPGMGGKHTMVADGSNPSTGSSQAGLAATGVADASGVPGSVAVVPSLSTARVIRGDSLWRISKKMLGHGIKYTEIYASNVSQIKDPALIYPGQIFVVPGKPAN